MVRLHDGTCTGEGKEAVEKEFTDRSEWQRRETLLCPNHLSVQEVFTPQCRPCTVATFWLVLHTLILRHNVLAQGLKKQHAEPKRWIGPSDLPSLVSLPKAGLPRFSLPLSCPMGPL